MLFESDLFHGMFNNLAIFIVMVFFYGTVIDRIADHSANQKKILIGICFGFFAFVAMHAKIPAAQGVIVDQRNAIVALSGAFGGPIAAAISVAIAGTYRVYLGGAGAFAGVVGLCLGGLAGILLRDFLGPRQTWTRAAVGAFGATLIILPGFLLVGDLQTGWALLKSVAIPYGTAIYLGLFLGALMLGREERRHLAETSLTVSERRFRDFAVSASDWFWETDPTHRLVTTISGDDDADAWDWSLLLGDAACLESDERRLFRDFLDQRRNFRGLVVRYPASPGAPRYLSINGKPRFGPRGAFKGFRGTITEVTDQVLAERQLREREERYWSVIATALDGFWVADANGRLTEVNDTYVKLSGYSREELLSMRISDLNVQETREEIAALIQRLARKGSARFATRHRRKNGELWDAEVSVRYVDIDGGRLYSFIRDISERKAIERQLIQAQKMEAVGQLTGGLAHDFNNALNAISISAGILKVDLASESSAISHLDTVLKGVERASALTRRLLDFSRADAGETRRVSVNELIGGMEGLIAKSLTPVVTLETVLAENIWPVDIDPGELEDSILNLSLNARDAMPEGGTLIIETVNKVLDQTYVDNNPNSSPGNFVMISISDTGCGMTPEVQDKVFEPFFTTKEAGKGTGLGMSMVYGFVRRSGGHVKVYSERGIGTTIHLFLPRAAADHVEQRVEPVSTKSYAGGSETILVVDDEPDLIESTVAFLQTLGYQTLSAVSGKEALERLRANKTIDLLFSDIIMPGGMDGFDLAIAARQARPDLKILLTSGFTRKREEFVNGDRRLVSELARRLLNKPYTVAELAKAVRSALDRKPTADCDALAESLPTAPRRDP